MYNLRPLARHCNGAFDREVGRLLQRTLYFWLYLSRAPNARQTRSDGGNPILGMTLFCTIECSSKNTIECSSKNTERRCGRAAVAECAHCGASLRSSCARECCGQVLGGYCHDYHVIHSCLKGSAPTELRPVPVPFRPVPHHYAV